MLEDIRANARVAAPLNMRSYMDMLAHGKAAKQKKENDRWKRELKAGQKHVAELDKIISKLYEDNALGRISEERYLTIASAYESEQKSLKEKCTDLTQTIDRSEEATNSIQNFLRLIRKYVDIQELSTQILNELIDKIMVYEKTENPDGSRSQRVDIYYKFIGFIPLDMKETTEAQMEEGVCKQVRQRLNA